MRTNILYLFIVVILITACGQTSKKASEEKSNQEMMAKLNRIIVNELTQITSGYILSQEKINTGDKTVMQTIIRQTESTDIEFVTIYITSYFNKLTGMGLSIYEPWTKNSNSSYPSYIMSLKLDKSISDFFFIFYTEKNGNKDLRIFYEIK